MKRIVVFIFLGLAIGLVDGCTVVSVANPRVLTLGAHFFGSGPFETPASENNSRGERWRVNLNENGDLKAVMLAAHVEKSLIKPAILSAIEEAGFAPEDVRSISTAGVSSLISINAGEFGGGVFIFTPGKKEATFRQVCADTSIGIFVLGDRLVSLSSLRHGFIRTGSAYDLGLGTGASESITTCRKLFDLPVAPVVATTWRNNVVFSDGSAIYAIGPSLQVEKRQSFSHQIEPTGITAVDSSILISAPPFILELRELDGRFSESWYYLSLN